MTVKLIQDILLALLFPAKRHVCSIYSITIHAVSKSYDIVISLLPFCMRPFYIPHTHTYMYIYLYIYMYIYKLQ